MKTRVPLIVALCWSWLAFISSAGAAPAAPAAEPTLHVHVIVPPSGDLWQEDRISEALVDSIRDSFRRRGYEGQIEEVTMVDGLPADEPSLIIRLIRWRQNRTGGVECTFGATVRSAHGAEQSLGTFSSMDPGISVSNSWTLAQAFVDTARQAANDLWRKLAEQNIVPGITRT